jgi:hypothetical protein
MDLFKNKYFKYKNKYLDLKNLIGGSKRNSKPTISDRQVKEEIKRLIPTISDDIIRTWTNFFKKYKSINHQEIQDFVTTNRKHINNTDKVVTGLIHRSQVKDLIDLICQIYQIEIVKPVEELAIPRHCEPINRWLNNQEITYLLRTIREPTYNEYYKFKLYNKSIDSSAVNSLDECLKLYNILIPNPTIEDTLDILSCNSKLLEIISSNIEKELYVQANEESAHLQIKLIPYRIDESTTLLDINSYLLQTLTYLKTTTKQNRVKYAQFLFDIEFEGQPGSDYSALTNQYLEYLSKEIELLFVKDRSKNILIESVGTEDIDIMAYIFFMIQRSPTPMKTEIKVLQLFKHFFIDDKPSIIEVLKNTFFEYNDFRFTFYNLLVVYIYHLRLRELDDISSIDGLLESDELILKWFLYNFALYSQNEPNTNAFIIGIFDLDPSIKDELVSECWNFTIDPNIKLLINKINSGTKNNIYKLYSFFNYKNEVNLDLFIKKLTFYNKFPDTHTEHMTGSYLQYYIDSFTPIFSGNYEDFIDISLEPRKEEITSYYGNHTNFMKKLLYYWGSTTYVREDELEYKINFYEQVNQENKFDAHSCFCDLDTSIKPNDTKHDIIIHLIRTMRGGNEFGDIPEELKKFTGEHVFNGL